VTEGIDALANTRVVIKPVGDDPVENAQGSLRQRTFTGTAASEDIVVASARAYLGALNKIIAVHQGTKGGKAQEASVV
jgi:2-isopropylmalate synthase